MNRLIKLLILIILIVIIALILPEERLNEKMKIGVSDDTSGFIVDYMLRDEKISRELEAYFIKDC